MLMTMPVLDENIEAVNKIIREVVEYVGISVGSCHVIFSDVLGMKLVRAIIPQLTCHYLFKNFWLKTSPFSCLSHRIHQTWPPTTFSLSTKLDSHFFKKKKNKRGCRNSIVPTQLWL